MTSEPIGRMIGMNASERYQFGRQMGREEGAKDAEREFKDIERNFGKGYALEWLRRQDKSLRETEKSFRSKQQKTQAYIRALDRLISLGESLSIISRPGDNGFDVPKLRKGTLRAMLGCVDLTEAEAHDLSREWRESFWFDMRGLPDDADGSMGKFGKELFEKGIFRFPYDDMVFVGTVGKPGEFVECAVRVVVAQDGVSSPGEVFMWHDGSSVFFRKDHAQLSSSIFYFLACMNARETETHTRSIRGPMTANTREVDPGVHYFMVSLRPEFTSSVNHGGTHATPRLHWRRGHTRTYASGAVGWVNAHLVGSRERGVIVHDYSSQALKTEPDRAKT